MPDGGDENEPGDGNATTATTRMQQSPPAPLGRSGNEHAANLSHGGDQAVADGSAAAWHAAEHTAEDAEDGAPGMRDESASSGIDGCGAHLGGARGVAGETAARTDDETLGEVGSQGVIRAPMADTDTAGTAECEVRAGASGAEGRGMDASDGFEVFATRSESVPGAVDNPGVYQLYNHQPGTKVQGLGNGGSSIHAKRLPL